MKCPVQIGKYPRYRIYKEGYIGRTRGHNVLPILLYSYINIINKQKVSNFYSYVNITYWDVFIFNTYKKCCWYVYYNVLFVIIIVRDITVQDKFNSQ